MISEPNRFWISLIPMLIITVTENHRVNVAIPEARQHVHSFGGNDFGIARHWQRVDRADRHDAFAFDQDDAVRQRRPAETVNQTTADERERAAPARRRPRLTREKIS